MEFTEYDMNELKSFFLNDSLCQEEIYHYIKKMLIDNFKLSNASKTPHYKILSFMIFNYMVGIENITTSYIKKKLGINGKKLNNILRMLRAKNFIIATTERTISLHPNIINIIFSLIKYMQNSNSFIMEFIEDLEDKDLKLSELKELAKEFLKDKNYLGYFEKNIVGALFDYYVMKANELRLVFVKKDAIKRYRYVETKKKNGEVGERRYIKELKYLQKEDLLILNYKTRFNSFGIIRKKINELEEIISNASKIYPYAFFITLTTDTKRFKRVLDAYKEINKNWNRLITAISKRLGYRPKYLKVLEFHKNGNPHLHILLFTDKIKKNGNWLISQSWLSNMWAKYGQGEIVRIYAVRRNNNTYTWLYGMPQGCKDKNLTSYLSKYLKKAFNDDLELSLYWVSNLRFFTASRGLKESIKRIPKGIWEFLGTFKEDDLNDIEEFIERLREIYINIKREDRKRLIELAYRNIERQYSYWVVG